MTLLPSRHRFKKSKDEKREIRRYRSCKPPSSEMVVDEAQIIGNLPTTKEKPIKIPAHIFNVVRKSKVGSKIALVFLGFVLSSLQWSFLLLLIGGAGLIWLESRDTSRAGRIKAKAEACSTLKEVKLEEIPSWIKYPDRERAEWLNQVIAQLWPTVNTSIVKTLRGSIQAKIRKKFETFRFEEVDFGCNPPKIDGIKVYSTNKTKDSIIIDFDVFYDGNCDINISIGGAQIGGIRDFQLSVEARLVLKPLLLKMPLIGGMQIFFLNTPDISFTLEGLTAIPGLSFFIRTKIEEKIAKKMVFPNKFTKRFSKSVNPSELKALEPAGVLRVHVFEAKDLMGKDISGKSDPYVILNVGPQEHRTKFVNQSLNPKWDHWCEFVIIDPVSQYLTFKVFDHDNVNQDDFLGSGDVVIATVIKGQDDQWINLERAKHGKIHLRFTWFSLSPEISNLVAAYEEVKLLKVPSMSTALLIIYVDSAHDIPEIKRSVKPHPFFTLTVANKKQKSKVKKHTTNPEWEEGFIFLVPDPNEDTLYMTIVDKQTDTTMTHFSYKISDLFEKTDLEISKTEFLLDNKEAKVILSLQLRILTNDNFVDDEESDSESSVDEKIIASVLKMPLTRTPSSNSSGEFRLGQIEISLYYSEMMQKLEITIHKITGLPLKHPSDIPDPYVKIKLTPQGTGTIVRFKTKNKIDCCDPVFEETFTHLASKMDVSKCFLTLTVKTLKFFHNNTMGKVDINLEDINLETRHRSYYDLCLK